MIPTDGSTMTVAVDGVALGTVDYNHCRAGASADRRRPARVATTSRRCSRTSSEYHRRQRSDRRVEHRHDDADQRAAHDRVGGHRRSGPGRRDRQPVLQRVERRLESHGEPDLRCGRQRPRRPASRRCKRLSRRLRRRWARRPNLRGGRSATPTSTAARASTSVRRWKRFTPTPQACGTCACRSWAGSNCDWVATRRPGI